MTLAAKLLQSFYVDNCVSSVNTYEEYEEFKAKATELLLEAKMDLRNWGCTTRESVGEQDATLRTVEQCDQSGGSQLSTTKILGLIWDKNVDTLSCEIPMQQIQPTISKRVILSCISKQFDPVGFICPSLL